MTGLSFLGEITATSELVMLKFQDEGDRQKELSVWKEKSQSTGEARKEHKHVSWALQNTRPWVSWKEGESLIIEQPWEAGTQRPWGGQRSVGLNDEAKESSLEYNFRQKLQTRAHILERSMFPKLAWEKVRRTKWRVYLDTFLKKKGGGTFCDKKNVISLRCGVFRWLKKLNNR